MSPDNNLKLIVAIVKKGMATKIVAAAKRVGAEGGTIIFARGTANRRIYESILGIEFELEKEVILIVVQDIHLASVLRAISIEGHLDEPGQGIGFVLNLNKVSGVARLLQVL